MNENNSFYIIKKNLNKKTMRARSLAISASNMEEFISILKEKEAEYIEESTLTQLNYISLKEEEKMEDTFNNEYNFLIGKSNYKIRGLNNGRKKRKKLGIFSPHFPKKKIIFHGLGRKRLNLPVSNADVDKTNSMGI